MKLSSNNRHSHYHTLRYLAPLLLLTISVAPTRADILDQLESKINSWRLSEAAAILEQIPQSHSDSPRASFLRGKLLFFEGNCSESLVELRRAIEGARGEIEWKSLRNLAEQAQVVYAELTRATGKSQKFVYRYSEGIDKILADYAETTLAAQLAALEQRFDDIPHYPIQVDFLPDAESLARVSGLSVERIERTGTVGITKYGRIMMISPQALATGYPWLDTLSHELTHLVVTRISERNCPIWLHEGIAKLMEHSWRGQRLGSLTPEEAYLLDRAAREGRLIPLRRFHPSIAYLPNQEDAALAYAQVLSFMLYLDTKLRPGWPKDLLQNLGKGLSVDSSLRSLSKYTLKRLYMWWRQTVSGRRQTPVPAVNILKKRYKQGKTTGDDNLESLLEGDVEKHVRVGDLLRLRGHSKAAAIEYRQAESLNVSPSPEISDRLAGVLLELGDTKSAIPMLKTITSLYPSHSTAFVQLGEALAKEKRINEAISALESANAINPFHPKVHCLLGEQYPAAQKDQEGLLEKERCRRLVSQIENK